MTNAAFENGRDSGMQEGYDECERHYQPLVDAVAAWAGAFRRYEIDVTSRGSGPFAVIGGLEAANKRLLAVSADFEPKE